MTNVAGRQVVRWHVVEPGQEISLGPTTAVCFPADHIASAVGWRADSDGMGVVFSADTRFNPELIKASQGARLLIHGAFRTDEEKEHDAGLGHSTSGDAGRSAYQAGVGAADSNSLGHRLQPGATTTDRRRQETFQRPHSRRPRPRPSRHKQPIEATDSLVARLVRECCQLNLVGPAGLVLAVKVIESLGNRDRVHNHVWLLLGNRQGAGAR